MVVYSIGNQRIGIVTEVPTGTVSEFMEPETTESVQWVDGCLFEVQTMSEQQGDTVTTSETAVAIMPVIGDRVPLVDDNGEPAGFKPVVEITSSLVLREFGTARDFVMRDDAVLQKDIRGRPDHVECRCEHEEG